MMKSRKIKVIAVYVAGLVIYYIVPWRHYLKDYRSGQMSILMFIENVMDLQGGYYDRLFLAVFCLAMVLLMLEFLMPQSEDIVILRYPSLSDYAYQNIQLVATNAVLISILHFLVGAFFMILTCPFSALIEKHYFPAAAILFIFMVMFYIRMGLIYLCVRKIVSKKFMALLFTVALNVVSYSISVMYHLKISAMMPINDLYLFADIYFHSSKPYNIPLSFSRNVLLIVVMIIIYLYLFKKRDVMEIEN